MREAIARFVDDSDFLDFKADYGAATVCGHAAVQGHKVGIVTNNGPLDPAGANKATHFIQACCQAGLPILYLQNTTGYIVGKASEEAGMIKHGSKMIQAVSNANVAERSRWKRSGPSAQYTRFESGDQCRYRPASREMRRIG